jgi:hypothetical protein
MCCFAALFYVTTSRPQAKQRVEDFCEEISNSLKSLTENVNDKYIEAKDLAVRRIVCFSLFRTPVLHFRPSPTEVRKAMCEGVDLRPHASNLSFSGRLDVDIVASKLVAIFEHIECGTAPHDSIRCLFLCAFSSSSVSCCSKESLSGAALVKAVTAPVMKQMSSDHKKLFAMVTSAQSQASVLQKAEDMKVVIGWILI